ncbi:MAG: trypsin-like peptidase domain-containing protein [Planctomycetota bacterium]
MHDAKHDDATPSVDSPEEAPAAAVDTGIPKHHPLPPLDAQLAVLRYNARLNRLLWVFGALLAALVAPIIVSRTQYAITEAKERAEADVARDILGDVNLDQISFAFRTLPKAVSPSVVSIRTAGQRGEGQGSGVIVDEQGYIVTNAHVVRGAATAEVQLSDGRSGVASLIGKDKHLDIAVLKTEMENLLAAEWGDSDALDVGDMVWALGSPFGLEKSITFGIVSAKERRDIGGRQRSVYQEFLQTDAAVNPGNSGGPLVNYEGKVVGINTAIIGPSYQGISFSIPSTLAKGVYQQILENGSVERGYLGIRPVSIDRKLSRELGVDVGGGVFVGLVEKNTPADDAGMRKGDVIISWNGQSVNDPTVMSRAIGATRIGSEVEVKVLRQSDDGFQEKTLNVLVVSRPPDESF